jgi:hypothetical protein
MQKFSKEIEIDLNADDATAKIPFGSTSEDADEAGLGPIIDVGAELSKPDVRVSFAFSLIHSFFLAIYIWN